jgi:hypothetical protein
MLSGQKIITRYFFHCLLAHLLHHQNILNWKIHAIVTRLQEWCRYRTSGKSCLLKHFVDKAVRRFPSGSQFDIESNRLPGSSLFFTIMDKPCFFLIRVKLSHQTCRHTTSLMFSLWNELREHKIFTSNLTIIHI